jgi:predicted MFS family arabinose efflux permease
MAELVTHRTHIPADAARERGRLWWSQRLFAAAWAAGTVGGLWLAVSLGGGPVAGAAVLAAALLPLALAAPSAARLAARANRRTLLWSSQAAAAGVLLACDAAAAALGVWAVVACSALLGLARAVFDGATADVLHHLTAPQRRLEACRDLTARFGAGHAAGLAGLLVVGLAAGPRGAVLLAAGLAAAGAVIAGRHHPDLDLRVADSPPLDRVLRAGLRLVARDRLLRGILVAGGWGIAIGTAQATILIVWLRDGVGLRGALVPALLAGFVAVRLGRPLVRRLAGRARPWSVVSIAFGVQAAASLSAYSADGSLGGASAYALSLAAGAFLGILVTRGLRIASPPELAPAVGLVAGAVWALAACAGAGLAAGLTLGVGLAETHLVLAALALAGAVGLTGWAAAIHARPAVRMARRAISLR